MLTIYKASAGSGKTFTLTYRYIKLLLSYKDESGRCRLQKHPRSAHRSILAVTFTNKATDEMKRRIIHELAVLGRMEPNWTKPSPYAGMLTKELGCTVQALEEASRMALRDLLFDFNFFQVSTIDSFFQMILRTFAREAELTGNYEVDLENDRAMETSLRSLFDSLRTDTASHDNARTVDWITQFLLAEIREGRGVAIFNRRSGAFSELMSFVKGTDTEEFKARYDEMAEYLAAPEKLERFRRQLAEAFKSHAKLTAEACNEALAAVERMGFDDGKMKITSALKTRLTDGALNGYDTSVKEGTTIGKILADISQGYNKALRTHLASNPCSELDDAILTALTHLHEGRNLRAMWSALAKQLYNLGMLQGVFRFIEEFRQQNNTFLLSDTNSILKQIIGDGDTPFVFERIGVWLNHFLIDEFQDTSRMQWEIMRPLVMEGQAIDADSLIIGDEKQCIYRFRSSDPTLLQHTVASDFGEKAIIEGDTPQGNTNWRSSSHVVRFNNALFSTLSGKLGMQDVYANVEQSVAPRNLDHGGYVEITSVKASVMSCFVEVALENMTRAMRRQLRAGYRGKDICVLVRGRDHGCKVIEHITSLTASDTDFRGLRVISDDAMMLGRSSAVRTIISVLRYVASLSADCVPSLPVEEDGDAARKDFKKRLRSMLNRFEYSRSLGVPPSEALRQALDDPEGTIDIKSDIASMDCFSITSLIERIIHRMFSPEECAAQCMYLSALQDAVGDYTSTYGGDLPTFLDWWDSKGSRLTVSAPDDDNAIRVMTIHKSKGLEFPCVHVPLLGYDMVSFKGREWFGKVEVPFVDSDVVPPLLSLVPSRFMESTPLAGQYRRRCSEQLLDEINILYVALTRASEELIVCYRQAASLSDTYPIGAVMDEAVSELHTLLEKIDEDEADADADSESESDEDSDVEVNRFAYGSPTQPQPEEERPPTALDPVTVFEMAPYATDDRPDLWANVKIDDLPDYSRPRDRGIMLHDVLARVYRSSGLHTAVARCSHAGLLPPGEALEIERFLADELVRPDVAPWFNGFRRAVTERTLLLPGGVHRRPDRIVWTADGHTDVIDYKFGEPHKAHHRQVRDYMDALHRMGHSGIRGFIWYVTAGNIMPVSYK